MGCGELPKILMPHLPPSWIPNPLHTYNDPLKLVEVMKSLKE